MRNTLGAALMASAIALGAVGAAIAQTETPAAATEAKSADPAAKVVIEKDLPGVQDDPRLDAVKAMSLRAVAQYPEAQIDPAKLAAIQADLAALSKPTS
jgi:hypothetical protein